MSTLFISDIHLRAERFAIKAAFIDFLTGVASYSEHLYILGDLFDFWIGDDAVQPENLPILTTLRALSDQGVCLSIMPGNHDFLYGEIFAKAINCQLLNDPCVIDLYGVATLITHGDLLCTNDSDYQQFRQKVRDPKWQAEQLAQPIASRLQIAHELQTQSRMATLAKHHALMDVNQITVEAMLREYQVYFMIHGHTHRPADYQFSLDGHEARRIVLPNWKQGQQNLHGKIHSGYLKCDRHGCQKLFFDNCS